MYGFTPLEDDNKDCGFAPLTNSDTEPVLGPVKSWSFSTLMNFEKCPYQVFLKSVKRLPEPENEFTERGTKIHTLAEDYVSGKLPELPEELRKLDLHYEKLRERYKQGKVQLEGEWAFTINWESTGWRAPDVWTRIKADAFISEGDTSARVVDYKTGKKFGNELKHNQQLQLYAIASFLLFPELEYIEVELWYIDQGVTTVGKYTRDEAMLFLPRWTLRGLNMTSTTEFNPKPTKTNCNYCPYRKTKDCPWAVEA